MSKKITPIEEVNPSTAKSRRRYSILDPIAQVLVNDTGISFSRIGTMFRQALTNSGAKSETEIRAELEKVLDDLKATLDISKDNPAYKDIIKELSARN